MPHSSGGGSHGGGSHGGSHGGSSGPHISTHYFAGARRYRKHHISTGRDEYIYASSKPQKAGLGSVIFMSIFSAIFLGGTGMAVLGNLPGKLKTHYLDTPAVHDSIDVIADDDALTGTLCEYQELTGICPVIYTTYHEEWKSDYEDLESYSYYMYTSNFKDEAHFVIVYSIPVSDLEFIQEDPETGQVANNVELSDPSFEMQQVYDQSISDVVKLYKMLPDVQREIVFMRFYQDMSFKEIAEELGISINTALGRMRYAIINMKRIAAEKNISFEMR